MAVIRVGSVVSFVVAYLVIRWFMQYIKREILFLWIYRIILGIIVLFFVFAWCDFAWENNSALAFIS